MLVRTFTYCLTQLVRYYLPVVEERADSVEIFSPNKIISLNLHPLDLPIHHPLFTNENIPNHH